MKKSLFGFLAVLAFVSAISFVTPTQKASAAWQRQSSFTQGMLNTACNNMTRYGSLNKGAINYGGKVSDWYCVITKPSWIIPQGQKVWIRNGDVCKLFNGSSSSFVTTNFNSPFGGYCARWR